MVKSKPEDPVARYYCPRCGSLLLEYLGLFRCGNCSIWLKRDEVVVKYQ